MTSQNVWNKTAEAGSGQAHNILGPYLTVPFLIRA